MPDKQTQPDGFLRFVLASWRQTVVLLVSTLLSPALVGCAFVLPKQAPAVATLGEPAPGFELSAVGADDVVRLADYRGKKPVVVNFFCGCHYCYELAHAWNRARSRVGDAQMLAIMHNRDTFNPVNVREFREATKWDAPILADLGSKIALRYRSIDCPMVWVIDRDGIVRYHNKERTEPPEQIVNRAIQALEQS